MRVEFEGATILITGASAGIGAELARQLAGRAGALILVARRTDRLQSLREELMARNSRLKVHVMACDLAQLKALDGLLSRVAQEAGPVDVLINNAGMGDFTLYEEASWSKTEQMLRLNVLAPAYLTRKLIGSMLERRRGGILNVSSLAGNHFFPGFAAYVGSKYFVRGFSESLRGEVAGMGIVVSQLCPGPVATEFEQIAAEGAQASIPSWVELSVERCARIALRGFGKGQAMIVPGILARLSDGILRAIPLRVRRGLACAMGSWIRRGNLTKK